MFGIKTYRHHDIIKKTNSGEGIYFFQRLQNGMFFA